jgi:exodeoxyribonuclease VIII
MKIIKWTEHMKIEPGNCYAGLPNALYHKGPGISKSGLDAIHRSPLYYKTLRDHPRPSTPTLEIGTAFHVAVLEPDLFAANYIPDPFPGSQSKAAKEARKELRSAGKIIVANDIDEESGIWGVGKYDAILKMAEAVRAHRTASILLDPQAGIPELSAYWVDQETKKLCKARADFYNQAHEIIVDLKSTTNAAMAEFAKSCASYRYHIQDAWYTDGFRAVGARVRAFVFVAVEKDPPYGVACYRLDKGDQELGRSMYQNDLRVYQQCAEADTWPNYGWDDETPQGIRTLYLPKWAHSIGIN